MKKTTGKIALIAALLMLATVCLTACGGNNNDTKDTPAANSFAGTKYVYEGTETSLSKEQLPEGYPSVAYDKFEAAYKAIAVDKTITTASTYEDVAKLFGDDGIKLAGTVYEGYAYYAWYSDKEFNANRNVGVLITFKDDGKKLTYYAYSSDTIVPDDVK